MFTGLRSSSVVLLAVSLPAAAQWLNYPTPGIPRLADRKANLAAPAPRKPDGKPDLSGIWRGDPQNRKYISNVASDFKPGEFPIQPWAEVLTKERTTGAHASQYRSSHCLPPGVPILDGSSAIYPLKIVQEPDLVMILCEAMSQFRQIFLDGRTLPQRPKSNLVWILGWPLVVRGPPLKLRAGRLSWIRSIIWHFEEARLTLTLNYANTR